MTILTNTLPTLIELNNSESQDNIFCIHPMGGGTEGYKRMADQLVDEAKFFAVEDPVIYDNFQFESFSDLAKYHIHTIKKVQPKGPYTLLGSCSGGPISYEIAHQLCNLGDVVDKVIIIGSTVTGFDSTVKSKYAFLSEYLVHRFKVYGLNGHLDNIVWENLEKLNIDEATLVILDELLKQDIPIIKNNVEFTTSYVKSIYLWRQAAKKYITPKSSFKVSLFKKHVDMKVIEGSPDWINWNEDIIGKITIVNPPIKIGSFTDITDQPYLQGTVKKLKEILLSI
jgi:surfactin synthase thioesterase subunit